MEPLTQSSDGRMWRSTPGSIYDFRVSDTKKEDTGEEAEREQTKSRRDESSAKEEMRNGRSGDKENKRSHNSEGNAEDTGRRTWREKMEQEETRRKPQADHRRLLIATFQEERG
ncbi:hypothetical protein NDU88_001891 [Pleurodeles waltl]|uniref:Uncharacterized protein n=1 Tax=Pleurodeles waltl TaxID=8319 RepID=A0AAV7M1S3_PLEWA|nr:hypothetical protein NDU88_001891 [Pleurodeles waltl]